MGPAQAPGFGDQSALAAPFPFHLVIDAGLRLQSLGHGLLRFDPGLRPGAAFAEHFVLHDPAGPAAWSSFAAAANRICVIAHRRTGLELRGQLLLPVSDGPAIFLGSSWLDDPTQLLEFGAGAAAGDLALPPPAYAPVAAAPALQLAVARCLAEAGSTADALVRLVDALPAALGWAGAAYWRLDAAGELQLERSAPRAYVPPAAAAVLIGRARSGGAPVLENSALALPVLGGSGTLGVVAAFAGSRRADADADPELLQALAVAAGLIAQFLARQAVGERLRRLTSELSAIFQLSPDGFVAFDEAGRLNYINPALLRLSGFGRDELEGIDEAAFEARLAALADPQQPPQPLAGDEAEEAEVLRLLRPRPRVLRRSRREARDPEGRLFGRILYFRDITRETEVDRMKNEFLSTAAHELRTPLASIHGFTELLLLRAFPAGQQEEILQTIFSQTTRLVEMVNGLLDLARIEAGAGEDFRRVLQPLLPLLETAVDSLLIRGDERRVVFVPAAADHDVRVLVDRDKLIRALTNVLSNAYKYSPQGGAITLTLHHAAGRIGIAVRDRGLGMSAAQVAKVFERFFRADPNGPIPGTGLGMSLVKQIIELHDGEVEVDSAPGKGTTVTMWLPRVDPPGAAPEPVAAAKAPARKRRQPSAGKT